MNYAKDMILSRNIYENGADPIYVKNVLKLLNKAAKNGGWMTLKESEKDLCLFVLEVLSDNIK